MSNENEFVASVNRLESLIDSNQQDLKREVGSLIDRRFSSLKEEVNKLKCAQSALDQINNLMALWDDRRDLSDLPNRIRHILKGSHQTRDLNASEVGDNVTVEQSANNLGENEFRTQEHVNSLYTNVPSTSTVLNHNLNSSTSDNEQVNYLSNVEPIPSAVYSSKDVPTSSSLIHTNIKTEDASNSQQSVQMCKRVKMDEDGQYITDSDSDCDGGSDDCIVKQEIKEEFDETCQLDPDNGQSVQLWTQVKTEIKEEVDSEEENVIGPEDGEELDHNQNEYLHESSNGTNQGSVNDQQVDKGDHGPSEPANDGQNESLTSKQSKTRKRRRPGKSQVTENSTFESSLKGEVSSPGPTTSSKRTRVSSSDRRTNDDQMSTQSSPRVDLSDGDDPNGIDSSGEGEKGVEQSEDEETWLDSETELGDDEDEGGNYKIRTIKLKCAENGCNAEVSNRVELHDHLRSEHHISPLRCLAEGCNVRFEQWDELGRHVQDNHSNISSWSCPHCTKTYKSQHCLYQHLHLYHFEGQFKCGYDGCHYDRVATFRSEILSHQQSVHPKTTNPTIFTCQFNNCGKSFNHKGHFNVHQQIHSGIKSFPCDWIGCDKSFTQKCNLDRHQRIHKKVKPFRCNWNMCDYASTQRDHVITHIRIKHFGLPKSQKEQRQLGIEDNRNPRDYLLNTTTPI